MLNFQDFVIGLLQEEGRVTPDALARATQHAAETGTTHADALVALNIVSAHDLAVARAVVGEMCFVDVASYEIDLRHASLLPKLSAEKLVAFPLFVMDSLIVVGMADPMDLKAVDRLRATLKSDVEPVQCEPAALAALIERAYSLTGGQQLPKLEAAEQFRDSRVDEDPTVLAVNQIIAQGIEKGASDIHINPDETELHLRYRIDGNLHPHQGPALAIHPGIIQRLKVMAGLDLTITRRPQDGKFRFSHRDHTVDIRLSLVPTVCGENAVLRILAGQVQLKDFRSLGFSSKTASTFDACFDAPFGMILATGPTGSGKTTTLYTGLKRVSAPDTNVITIEDPVEIRLPLVRQVQVHAESGLTFATALRSILRQDPDVVLVGEIRDEETARIAIQAALTGHLVLSTLHTNDAPGAIARLIDFNVPLFAINAALLCALAQRLVRRICPHCAKPAAVDQAILHRFGLDSAIELREGAGCPNCLNSGYKGRVGVHELMRLTPAIKMAIETRAPTTTLRQIAVREGMTPMWVDGLEKARLGQTTITEVVQVAAGNMEGDREVSRTEDALEVRTAA